MVKYPAAVQEQSTVYKVTFHIDQCAVCLFNVKNRLINYMPRAILISLSNAFKMVPAFMASFIVECYANFADILLYFN